MMVILKYGSWVGWNHRKLKIKKKIYIVMEYRGMPVNGTMELSFFGKKYCYGIRDLCSL
jgi:hypothetical protein